MKQTTPLFSKIDESFIGSGLLNYELVLQVSERSCAYSIFDFTKNSFIVLESYDVLLSAVIERNQWLKDRFRSVRILVENNRSTLIPSELFDESGKEAYLNFSLEPEAEEKILFDRLFHLDIVNVYGINGFLYDQLIGFFPGAKICHISSVMIESIWMNFKNLITDKRIFIFIRDEAFNMMIFEKKQLLYSNVFLYRAPEDFIFFVIFVMEQLDLNPEEVPVTLFGNIRKDSPIFKLIFKYVRNVDFALRSESSRYSYVFDDLPGHSFYALLNPAPCGS
jgi:hypothetical protein